MGKEKSFSILSHHLLLLFFFVEGVGRVRGDREEIERMARIEEGVRINV